MDREELVERFFTNQRTIFKTWKAHFQQLMGDNPLTHAQLSIMFMIHQEQPISGRELAAKMDISPSAVTQMLDALDQLGFIDRCEDEADRRITHIRLSEAGACKISELEEARNELLERLAAVLTDDELRAIVSINDKMIKELES